MEFKELLMTLLQGILVAVVPVITAFVVAFINSKIKQLAEKNGNRKNGRVSVLNIICCVVGCYIHYRLMCMNSKKADKFSEANQKIALDKALESAKLMLTKETKTFIEKAYGDIDKYLEMLIEESVNVEKNTCD